MTHIYIAEDSNNISFLTLSPTDGLNNRKFVLSKAPTHIRKRLWRLRSWGYFNWQPPTLARIADELEKSKIDPDTDPEHRGRLYLYH